VDEVITRNEVDALREYMEAIRNNHARSVRAAAIAEKHGVGVGSLVRKDDLVGVVEMIIEGFDEYGVVAVVRELILAPVTDNVVVSMQLRALRLSPDPNGCLLRDSVSFWPLGSIVTIDPEDLR
jgi:hypothetical protein